MTKRLLNLLTVLSLLLCVALCVLWVRSGTTSDTLSARPLKQTYLTASSSAGLVELFYLRTEYPYDNPRWDFKSEPVGDNLPLRWFRFDVRKDEMTYEALHTTYVVEFPHWALLLACSLLPLVRLRRLVERRATVSAGRCPGCGYDLRATPDRCPECGTMPTARPAA